MLRSGDIVNHLVKIYPNDKGSLIVGEHGLPTIKQYNENEYINIEKRLAIIEYSFGETFGQGANDGEFSIRYLDTGHSLSWISNCDLEYVCTSKDYLINQLKEKVNNYA